jgi:hypothetical protein
MIPSEDHVMTISDKILAAADAIAKRSADKIDRLLRESARLEAQLQQKKLELSVIQAGPKRRATFSAYDGAKIVCPACWIERSERAFLDPLPGDALQCRACDFKIIVSSPERLS